MLKRCLFSPIYPLLYKSYNITTSGLTHFSIMDIEKPLQETSHSMPLIEGSFYMNNLPTRLILYPGSFYFSNEKV